jgi:hypothetical protein
MDLRVTPQWTAHQLRRLPPWTHQIPEAYPPVIVQRHDLAIQDHFSTRERPNLFGQFPETCHGVAVL